MDPESLDGMFLVLEIGFFIWVFNRATDNPSAANLFLGLAGLFALGHLASVAGVPDHLPSSFRLF